MIPNIENLQKKKRKVKHIWNKYLDVQQLAKKKKKYLDVQEQS